MAVEDIHALGEVLGKALSGLTGIGTVFILIGLIMLAIIGFGLGIHYLIKLFKQIPNLTVWDLVKYTTLFAVILIILGLVLP